MISAEASRSLIQTAVDGERHDSQAEVEEASGMQLPTQSRTAAQHGAEGRCWHDLLRALREARGITQDGWAARLGVSRATVQRWESGERVPDPGAEESILAYCHEAGLFRTYRRGPLVGLSLTVELLRDVLAQARWQAGRPFPAEAAPEPLDVASTLTPRSNLPASLSSFIGREREIADVRRVQAAARLLTLTGIGGCGKTRLALEVAGELLWAYPHGVWLVDLAGLSDPTLLPQAVVSALGVRTTGQQPATDALVGFLGGRHLLLVLDNCEHLAESCASLTETLLRACPHLEVLATSREPLGIAGETVWRVPPLSLPSETLPPAESDAVRLFVERARLCRPDFALTDANESAVVAICRRLDGIPLAQELAAARMAVLAAEQIADLLTDRFDLLTSGSRTALPRHQTLRAALDWSYELLTEPEQALLRRLPVFAGGFTLAAAEAVCGEGNGQRATSSEQRATGNEEGTGPPLVARCSLLVARDHVLDLLAALVHKSLVNADEQDGAVRYRLLETVRQYVGEKLDEAGEVAAVRDRHLVWCSALAQAARAEFRGVHEPRALMELEREHDNLRAALAWSLTRQGAVPALRLAVALARFWELRGHLHEGRQWLMQSLAAGSDAPAGARAQALHSAGWLAYTQGDYAAARTFHEESLILHAELQEKQGIADAHNGLGRIALRQGDPAGALRLLDAALALYVELAHKPGIASAEGALGSLALRRGDYTEARTRLEASLALNRELGNRDGVADVLEELATVAGEQGEVERQAALVEESLAVFRELGSKDGIALALGSLGMLAWVRREYGRALALLRESMAIYRDLGDRRGIARSLGNQSLVTLAQGDHARAAALCRESLALYRATGDTWGIGRYLPVLAGAVFAEGRADRAARLFAAATALRGRLGTPLPPLVQPAHDRVVAAARANLGEAAFAAAWTDGDAMSAEEAVAYALGEAAPA
jgi:non-specific serine/threonine protein kinase